ncbi:FAD-dependent oxidoreductase [Litorivivens sp.]|uniref:FAD-dependent oxidoreductase n=1 Tax=Litorivivens sp. TaxID=2020868 RepID=UPI00356AA529
MNIAIAGVGLMGRLIAWQLQRRGHQLTLFDAGDEQGTLSAAYVAAAMLAPYSEAVTSGAEMFALGKNAIGQWRELLRQLAETGAHTIDLKDSGSVVVAHELDRASLQHFSQKLRAVVGDDSSVKALDRSGITELEPELPQSFRQGLWLAGEGCLDNRALLSALRDTLVAGGAQWRSHVAVQSVEPGVLHTAARAESFDWVVDCRGLGAKADWPDVRGVRGEILWVKAPEVRLSRPVRLMHPRYHLYITPKPGDIYVVGATEIESESQAPVTVRSELELLSALYSVHSGFAEAHIVHSFARCRPALPDNLPLVRVIDGLLQVNGLYRHGYLLAPVVLASALRAFEGDCSAPFVSQMAQNTFACKTGSGR